MGVFDKIKGKRITDPNLIAEIMGTNPTSPHSLKDKKYYHFYGEIIEGVHPQKGTVYYRWKACTITFKNEIPIRGNIDILYNVSSLLSGYSFFGTKNAKENFEVDDENKKDKIKVLLMNKPIEVYEEMAPNKVRWKYLETDNFINAVKALDEKDCSEEF